MLELTMIYPFTYQLVIKDGVFTQQNVPKLLTDCRKFVGHFKHSPLACQKLEVIQIRLHLPIHKLIQDIITQWDYALLMFDRLFGTEARSYNLWEWKSSSSLSQRVSMAPDGQG